MMFLSSSSSTFSAAFLLALLVANQLVDARGFAVKSAPGSGTKVDVDSKEGAVWTDGPVSMSINLSDGAENIPVVSGEEKDGPCTTYKFINVPDAIAKCQQFGLSVPCTDLKLDCVVNGNCTCCCKN